MGREAPGVRRAVVWSAIETGGLALLSFGTLIVFARLLTPADFGLFSMVLAIVEIGVLLASTFFHDALIQRERVDESHYDTAFTVSLVISLLVVALCVALAGPFARWAGADHGAAVLIWTSLTVPASALSATAAARLKRELNLRPLALRSLVGRSAGAAVGILLVVAGMGIWGMVAQQVLIAALASLMLWLAVRPRYRLHIHPERLGELARFGIPATASLLLTYSVKRVFVILAGIGLGPEAAGLFNLGFRVVEVLWSLCWNAVAQIVLPLLSREQGDAPRTRAAFGQATQATAFALFPLFGLIAVLAAPIVQILFGPRWSAAVPVVAAMAIVTAIQAPRLLIASALSASGRPGLNAGSGAVEMILVLALFALPGPATLPLVVGWWALREVMGTCVSAWLLHRQGVVTLRRQWMPTITPAVAVVAMLLAGTGVAQGLLPAGLHPLWQIAALGSCALLVYGLAWWLLDREALARQLGPWLQRLTRAG